MGSTREQNDPDDWFPQCKVPLLWRFEGGAILDVWRNAGGL